MTQIPTKKLQGKSTSFVFHQRMAIDNKLLEILACPETKEPVTLAEETLIEKINAAIEAGTLQNRGGEKINEKIDGGLLRQDKKYLYPIRDDIPIMLIDEAIPVE